MIRNQRLTGLLTILLGAALVGLRSNEARGQWGGFGGFNYVSQPTDFLNQRSLMNSAHASGPVSNNVYAGNPNAYVNHVRDNGFIPTYDVVRRVPTSPRPTRTVSPGSSGDTIPNCLGEFWEINERTGIAAYGHPAGTPEQAGVERLGQERTVNG